jgi:hypothetical protein
VNEIWMNRFGVAPIVTALSLIVIVLIATTGITAYQYASDLGNKKGFETTETITTTATVVSDQITLPTNLPKSCITDYPNGLDLNYTNYFLLTNPTAVIAQICVKYTYVPQRAQDPAASQIVNGSMDANFTFGAAIMYQDSFGNASQGGPLSFDIVNASPSTYLFNSTGQSVVVVYTIGWYFIYSQFIPAYVGCTSSLAGIGVSESTGPGTSGLKSACPNGSIGSMFNSELVGTSYLKLETS